MLFYFFINNTFISNTRLRFNLKYKQSQVPKGVRGKTNIVNEKLPE